MHMRRFGGYIHEGVQVLFAALIAAGIILIITIIYASGKLRGIESVCLDMGYQGWQHGPAGYECVKVNPNGSTTVEQPK